MKKTTVYLPEEMNRMAEPRLPLFESGEPDLAERVDDLMGGFGDR